MEVGNSVVDHWSYRYRCQFESSRITSREWISVDCQPPAIQELMRPLTTKASAPSLTNRQSSAPDRQQQQKEIMVIEPHDDFILCPPVTSQLPNDKQLQPCGQQQTSTQRKLLLSHGSKETRPGGPQMARGEACADRCQQPCSFLRHTIVISPKSQRHSVTQRK